MKDNRVLCNPWSSGVLRRQAAINSQPNQYVASPVSMPARTEGKRNASGVTPSRRKAPATSQICRPSRPKLAGKNTARQHIQGIQTIGRFIAEKPRRQAADLPQSEKTGNHQDQRQVQPGIEVPG